MSPFSVDSTVRPIDPLRQTNIEHRTISLNERTYHCLCAEPSSERISGTVVLVHGFQDISFGWRNQIPDLQSQGFRVIAIDCIGYGGTDSPPVPPASIELYTFKRTADDIFELTKQLGVSKIILGGHDWGGLIVTRVYLYHPEIVAGIFSAGTPYLPPEPKWLPFDEYVQKFPTFKYQKHFGGSQLEFETPEEIRLFFIAGYYGKGPNGELPFSTERALTENWPKLIKSEVLSDEELDYYTQEYARHGMKPALNWYRNRRQNFEDELSLSPDAEISVPFIFIQSLRDPFLPPVLSQGMESYIPKLRRREVEAGHFSLVLQPDAINGHVRDWLHEEILHDGTKAAE